MCVCVCVLCVCVREERLQSPSCPNVSWLRRIIHHQTILPSFPFCPSFPCFHRCCSMHLSNTGTHTLQDLMLEELIRGFEEELTANAQAAVSGLVDRARAEVMRLLQAVEQARVVGVAEVEEKRAALEAELQAMQQLQQAQDSRVELDVGGHRYSTSVATLRSKPGSMLDAMFSGRHQLSRAEDGSVFIDRDGSRFGYVLDYFRDGVVAVDAQGDSRLLRQLKREFGFYAIDLYEEQEVAFAAGGRGSPSSSVERYDPMSNTWTAVSPMSTSRTFLGMCAMSGQLYVSGGRGNAGGLATVERYTPSTDTWTPVAAMPSARWSHCACAVDGLMYVMDGHRSGERLRTMIRYTPETDSWSEMASMPGARCLFGACVLGRDIFVVGGVDESIDPSSTVYRYSVDANHWDTVAPLPEAADGLGVCALDGMMYAAGGLDDSGGLSSMHRYDPTSDSWAPLAPMTKARWKFAFFVVGGCIYAADADSAEMYNPSSDSWSAVSRMNNTHWSACGVTLEVDVFDTMIAQAARAEEERDR